MEARSKACAGSLADTDHHEVGRGGHALGEEEAHIGSMPTRAAHAHMHDGWGCPGCSICQGVRPQRQRTALCSAA